MDVRFWILILGLGLMCGWAGQDAGWAAQFHNRQEHALAYKAQQDLEKGKPRECVHRISPYLAKEETPAATLFVLCARAQRELGRTREALSTYARAAGLYPQNALVLRNYAQTCLDLDRLSEAAEILERVFALEKDPKLLYQAGAAWYQAGRFQKAVLVLQRLLGTTQDRPEEWITLLTYSLVQDKQWEQAETLMHGLLQKKPQAAHLWRLLAHVRLEQDDLLGGASALYVAYSLNPPLPKKWQDLASLYASARVPLMAVQVLQGHKGDKLSAALCWQMGQLYAQALRLKSALDWMDRALAQETRPEWILEKARVLYAHGRFEQCWRTARQAGRSDFEKRGDAWLLAGYAAWQGAHWVKAQRAFTRATHFADSAGRAASCLQTVRHILDMGQQVQNSPMGQQIMDAGGARG